MFAVTLETICSATYSGVSVGRIAYRMKGGKREAVVMVGLGSGYMY
jgi:hypothetical protein